MFQDGALSQTPTITTYKAVKRTASTPSQPANKRTSLLRQTSASQSETTSAAERRGSEGKLPGSVKNIAKLSTQADIVNLNSSEEVETNNNPAHG